MLGGLMTNAWIVATVVAVLSGVVGLFVVLRGAAFAAHALSSGAFAGAAGASLLAVSPFYGLAACSLAAALSMGALGRRGRRDVASALALVLVLALGALLLSRSGEYEAEVTSLLFGELLGVASTQVWPVALLTVCCLAALCLCYRPLLYSSTLAEVAAARGAGADRMGWCFLLVLALATAVAVPVVGALLVFSLMIGPPAAARAVTARPGAALGVSVLLALLTVWAAIAGAYLTGWPVGFYVGTLSACCYGAGRGLAALRARSPGRSGLRPAGAR